MPRSPWTEPAPGPRNRGASGFGGRRALLLRTALGTFARDVQAHLDGYCLADRVASHR